RIQGWKDSLKKAGIAADKRLARETDGTGESAYRQAVALLEEPSPPTAFFASNFLITAGILKAIREKGLHVPDEVELANSDDFDWLDSFHPPISTIEQTGREMGITATELLFKRIAEPDRPYEFISLKPKLIARTQIP